MSELTREDVLQILDLIDKAHCDFFELQVGDLKLVVNNTGQPSAASGTHTTTAPAQPAASSAPPVPQAPQPVPARAVGGDRTGLVAVTAPMVGVFYGQPEPGSPPFVEVGAHVDQESTMGLIEVMKVYTAIRADVRGTVVEILVHNTDFVEYGQTLFYVRADASPA
ncbi:MAG: acetyl-CoA carboxylase, biotin carboxyl carrier protein [Chloroflexi bacterium]|nr:acetyl-CoA carboxylase, biotin carboxyl carrier protein [Chloroflexota bacterium]